MGSQYHLFLPVDKVLLSESEGARCGADSRKRAR